MYTLEASRSSCPGVRLVVAAALFLAAVPAWPQSYFGKLCLQSTATEDATGPITPVITTSQYEVTDLGGNTYSLAGYLDSPGQPMISTGTATVVGSYIYINVTNTQNQTDGWRSTGINQTRLNVSDLSGTFYEVGRDFDPGTQSWNSRYSAGTVAQTTCP